MLEKRMPVVVLILLAVVLATAPAAAETFTLKLSNGTSFLTRYQPQEASWDPGMVLILTEQGNWIGIPRETITEVTAATEVKGFGKLINTTTILLGYAPNDAALPDEEPTQTPFDLLRSMLEQQPVYDQEQFVSPREAGGGLPVGYATGVGGGGGVVPVPLGGGGQ